MLTPFFRRLVGPYIQIHLNHLNRMFRCKVKDVNFKFQLKWSSRLDLRSNLCIALTYISYCVSFIMVTITRQVFTNIFQTEPWEHISAAKFAMGYEKNMSFLVIPKSLKVWKTFVNSKSKTPLSFYFFKTDMNWPSPNLNFD